MLIYQNCFSFLSLNHNMHVCYLRRSLFDILWVSCFFFGPTLIPLASWKDLDYCFAISVPFFPSFFFFIIWRVSLFKNSLTLRKHLQYKFWYLDNRYAIFRKIGIAFWQWKEKSTAVHIDIDIVYERCWFCLIIYVVRCVVDTDTTTARIWRTAPITARYPAMIFKKKTVDEFNKNLEQD